MDDIASQTPAAPGPARPTGIRLGWILALAAVSFIVVSSVVLALALIQFGAIQHQHQEAARFHSSANLTRIGVGAAAHDEDKGHLPRNLTDPDGKPILSWRVALLPYLDENDLHGQFHLDKPWDSPHNLHLIERIPKIYVLPGSDREAAQGLTFYQGFAGRGTVFDPTPGFKISLRQIGGRDGVTGTIFAAEAADAVPWTKPADIPFDPDGPLPPRGGRGTSGRYYVLTCDGSARLVHPGVSERSLRAAITYDGREPMGDDW